MAFIFVWGGRLMRGVAANILKLIAESCSWIMNFAAGLSFYCASAALFLVQNLGFKQYWRKVLSNEISGLEISLIKGNQEALTKFFGFIQCWEQEWHTLQLSIPSISTLLMELQIIFPSHMLFKCCQWSDPGDKYISFLEEL